MVSSELVTRMILALSLGAARTVPITWLIPTFGGAHLPPGLRVALGFLLALLGLSPLLASVETLNLVTAGPLMLALVLARELAVGVTVGLAASFLFRAAEMAGRLVDIFRGANVAEVFVPLSDERGSPTGNLYLFVATVIFLELGGPGQVLGALLRSYEAVPLGVGSAAAARGAGAAVIVASAQLLVSAIGLAAPLVVALLLTDVALGALARVAPQIPVYFVGMPLKALLGVGVVLIGFGALEAAVISGFAPWLQRIERVWHAWSEG